MAGTVYLVLRIFMPFAAGYFLSYLFRVVNAVIAPDLIRDVGASSAELGLLTSVYFLTFAMFQLPLGILLDRYGPKRVEALLLTIAGGGALIFSQAETIWGLMCGRALIGFGVSACLMAAFKAYTMWFAKERWPLVNGFQMAAGGLGALAATTPVEMLLHLMDWRGVFLVLAAMCITTGILLVTVVPEKDLSAGVTADSTRPWAQLMEIFSNREFQRLVPLTTFSQAAFLSIQGLWAGPWLTHVAGLERAAVANTLLYIAAAMVVGFITMGSAAAWLSRRGVSVSTTAVAGMAMFLIFQLGVVLNPGVGMTLIWLGFGFFGTTGILSYAALNSAFPVHLAGRVSTAVNLLVFIFAFAGQWFVGGVIELLAPAPGVITEKGFASAFAVMLIVETLCLVWYLARRSETSV